MWRELLILWSPPSTAHSEPQTRATPVLRTRRWASTISLGWEFGSSAGSSHSHGSSHREHASLLPPSQHSYLKLLFFQVKIQCILHIMPYFKFHMMSSATLTHSNTFLSKLTNPRCAGRLAEVHRMGTQAYTPKSSISRSCKSLRNFGKLVLY